jgi:hypothetical protein
MSSTVAPETSTSTPATAEQKEVLAIEPPPAPGVGQSQDDDGLVSLDVGEGNVVKLDKLGPLVVNSDGVSCLSLSPDLFPVPVTNN